MNILIIGANGGIGRQAVEIALQAGHRVTALLRNPDNLPISHPRLDRVKGDILDPRSFEKYVIAQDAVISTIGVKGGFGNDKPTTLYSQGSINLLQAMARAGVGRVYFISAAALEISPVLPFFIRLAAKYIVQKLLKNMYADLRLMEERVKASGLSWTIMRPPRLTDKPVTGQYRVGINVFLKNCLSISRADVAHFMIGNLNNTGSYQTTIEIGY